MGEAFLFSPDIFLRWLNEGRETASGERNEDIKRRVRAYVDPWLDTGLGHEPTRPNQECSSLRNDLLPPISGYSFIATSADVWQRYVSAEHPGAGLAANGTGLDDFAKCLFTLFLLNRAWRNEIAKCRYDPCGMYFRLRFPNKTRVNGLFCCREHQQAASAGADYERRAKGTHQRLVEHAATKYKEWLSRSVEWQRKNSVKKWLRDQINSFIARDPGLRHLGNTKNKIHVNWVTRHHKEIGL
jgi:hypothetical protein